jgi:hypothetical protein
MAENDPDRTSSKADMARFLISVNSELEAEAIRGRLSGAGIGALAQGALQDKGIELGTSRDIYVNDEDLDRAKAVLAEGASFTDDELAELSEQAYDEAMGTPRPPADG